MDTFFGLHIPAGTLVGMTLALALSVVLGGLVGLERELHGHPAGLRTHILVCLGSTLITLVSVRVTETGKGDPGRIAAQIVTGIGFLGAGAIIRDGAAIRGLTTAASIWTTAGIGLAVGISPALGQIAVIATLIVLFTLWILNWAEDWLETKGRRMMQMELQVRSEGDRLTAALSQIAAHRVTIKSIRHETSRDADVRTVLLRLRPPKSFDRAAFLQEMTALEGIVSVHLE
jgi:putative Mg2+ transporter-C (MgtC) family protein